MQVGEKPTPILLEITMKSWNQMSQEAKNKRRAKPSERIHATPSKKAKNVVVQCRYTGPKKPTSSLFDSDFFNREWRHYSYYSTIKGAEQAVITLNRKEQWIFEYRVKTSENT